MRTWTRKNFVAGLALSAGALLSAAGFAVPPSAMAAEGPGALTDGVADTIDRNSNEKLASARTDIIAATVESGAGGIVLTFKTQEIADPATDPNWASKNTFVTWQLDSNGDGKPESLARFSADREKPGGLFGEVTHFPGPGQGAKKCDAPASFNPATGYSLVVAPSCMNNPASVSYRVQLTYDTAPAAPKPLLAFDVAPDQGLAGPVPIVIPTAPAAAPPAGEAPAPAPAPTEGAAPPAAGAPDPASAPSAPKGPAPAKKPGAKAAPKPAPATRGPAAAPAPKPAAPAAPAGTPTPALAATGPSSARWLGTLGGTLLLLGGLSLMVPADGRRHHTV